MAGSVLEFYSNMTWNNTYTSVSSNKTELSADLQSIKANIAYVCFVIKGVIIPLGLICNTLSVVVFVTSRALMRTSTGNYLMALSIADWMFLVGDLIRWMHSADPSNDFYLPVNFMFTNNIICKLTHFIRYGCKLTSAWITVAITTERLISVQWPLHAHTLSTPARAKIVISLMYCLCFILGSYPLWTVGVGILQGVSACRILNAWEYNIWSWIILRFGSLLIPGLVMCILTWLIIVSLTKAKDNRLRHLSCNKESRQEPGTSHNLERQLTIILLSVAIAFILLRLPYTFMYYINELIYNKIWNPISPEMAVRIWSVTKIADVIATSNYALNFFLYCVCGSIFRRQLKMLFRKFRITHSKHFLSNDKEFRTNSTSMIPMSPTVTGASSKYMIKQNYRCTSP